MQWNISKAREVWKRLGNLLQREGEDIRVSDLFYREVIQAVMLSRSESWAMSDAMMRAIEGTHTRSLRHITGKR